MKRFLFILSGNADPAAILSTFAAQREPDEPFDIIVYDNATLSNAAAYVKANPYAFGAIHTLARRSEVAQSESEAGAAARAFAAEHFPAHEIVLAAFSTQPAAPVPNNAPPPLPAILQWENPASTSPAPVSEQIESFCTVATENFLPELLLLIHSLRSRSSKPIYIAGDTAVCAEVNARRRRSRAFDNVFAFRLATRGRLEWLHTEFFKAQRAKDWPRNDYPHCPPACMVKMDIAQRALELSDNTLFLDADFIVINSMAETIAAGIDCAFTPSWHSPNWKGAADTFGRYNAGCVFVRNESFPQWWREGALHRSKFMDQQILDAAQGEGYECADLSPAHNFGFWRIWHDREDLKDTAATGEELAALLGFTQGDEGVLLHGAPLVSFHVQMFHDTPGHAPLRRLVRHLLETSRNPLQAGLVKMLNRDTITA